MFYTECLQAILSGDVSSDAEGGCKVEAGFLGGSYGFEHEISMCLTHSYRSALRTIKQDREAANTGDCG